MTDTNLIIGDIPTNYWNLLQVGKGSYVLARTAFRTPMTMFNFLPVSFYLMHHSIETCVKAHLVYHNIKYSHKDGHKLIKLLELGHQSSKDLHFFKADILENEKLNKYMTNLQDAYNKNRYSFPGYQVDYDDIRNLLDELIYILTNQFFQIYKLTKTPPNHLDQIDVPENLLSAVEYRQRQPFTFCVIPQD